jgi:hypothetical protein
MEATFIGPMDHLKRTAIAPHTRRPPVTTSAPARSASGGLRLIAGLAALGALFLAGCRSPLTVEAERDLRRSVLDSVRRELAQPVRFPEQRVLERGPGVERLQLSPELLPELERMAGPGSYDPTAFPMDPDLLGQTQQMVPITLEQAVRSAVHNNLAVQFARLSPALGEAQVIAAEAAFDSPVWIMR